MKYKCSGKIITKSSNNLSTKMIICKSHAHKLQSKRVCEIFITHIKIVLDICNIMWYLMMSKSIYLFTVLSFSSACLEILTSSYNVISLIAIQICNSMLWLIVWSLLSMIFLKHVKRKLKRSKHELWWSAYVASQVEEDIIFSCRIICKQNQRS